MLCTVCKNDFPFEGFYPRPDRKIGRSSACRQCHIRKSNDHKMFRLFGLTPTQYAEMLMAQKNVCRLCGRAPTDRRLAVDHDHSTGKIRGLLCQPCNNALGLAHDDPILLRKMADYLEEHNATN